MTISFVVITFNEQSNIVPLLNNIYDMADEIVIIDGCSKDKTVKLIEEFRKDNSDSKIKLYMQVQQGSRYSRGWNQSVQRNLAITRCTKDWIFAIDADERLAADTRSKLEQLASDEKWYAFAMPTYHYWEVDDQIRIDDKWYPDYHYRFWKNHMGIVYSRARRHCSPIIPNHPEVRGLTREKRELPFTDIVIHHYHHVPIKKSGSTYRANFKDVTTVRELFKGLETKKVLPRTKMEREK